MNEKTIFLANLEHRGEQIRRNLEKRRMLRRSRRNRKTRYRAARFDNRKKTGLPPSVEHRVQSIKNLIVKLAKIFNISAINVETSRFDTQKMQAPEISGVEYQQETLQGYEIREYLLGEFNRTCVYCGAKDTKLEIDHVIARSKGGSDRVSNLVIACHDCNQKKDNLPVEEFCPEKAEEIKKLLKKPLKDAAVMNAIRYRIADNLKKTWLCRNNLIRKPDQIQQTFV